MGTSRTRTSGYRSEARSAPKVEKALKKLGARIRFLRKARELTQEEVAAAANLDGKHVQVIEGGKTNVTVASLLGIAKALDVSLSELLAGV